MNSVHGSHRTHWVGDQNQKLTPKSPGCMWDWISLFFFLLVDTEGKRLPILDLIEVKSSLESLCFGASNTGETGDWSIFSFLFIVIAKLEVKITVMEDQKCPLISRRNFAGYSFICKQFCSISIKYWFTSLFHITLLLRANCNFKVNTSYLST